MKLFKALLVFFLLIAVTIGVTAFYLWQNRISLLEKVANQAAHELFEGSLRLKTVELTRDYRIVISNITGTIKTENERIPLEVSKIETKNSIKEILMTQRSEMIFQGFKPIASKSNPISGIIRVRFGKYSSIRLNADLNQVLIQDYRWLNPAGFEGTSGIVSGTFQVRIDSHENAKFDIDLRSDEKGGEVPARFLGFALSYLPSASQNSKELKKLIAADKSVHFSSGIIKAGITEPGKMQMLIKMAFPEQNLNLNLNLTILIDEQRAFFRAFKLLGLFKIQNA